MIAPKRSLALHEERLVLRSGFEVHPVAVSLEDAARLLAISVSTLRTRLVAPAGGTPAIASIKLGGCRVIAFDELKRWATAETERQRSIRIVSRTTTPEPSTARQEVDVPIAVQRALGQTTRRPRLHSVGGTRGAKGSTDG